MAPSHSLIKNRLTQNTSKHHSSNHDRLLENKQVLIPERIYKNVLFVEHLLMFGKQFYSKTLNSSGCQQNIFQSNKKHNGNNFTIISPPPKSTIFKNFQHFQPSYHITTYIPDPFNISNHLKPETLVTLGKLRSGRHSNLRFEVT